MPLTVLQSNVLQQRFVTMTTDANSHPNGADGCASEDVKKDLKERIKLKYQKLGRDIHPEYKPDIKYALTPEEEEKRERRRKQNREAAQRCRVKKKGEESEIYKTHAEQKAIHKEYTAEIERLSMEIVSLQEELRHHDCCLRKSTTVTQDAHNMYCGQTETRPGLQPTQSDSGTRGASVERNTGVPVFHPSPSPTPDTGDVDMTSMEASDTENCGWASSVNASMQLGDDSEGLRPFSLMRSESTGFTMTSRRDPSSAESRDVDYMGLFGSGSPVPTTMPSVPTSGRSLETGANVPSRTLESDLGWTQTATIPQQCQTKRMLLEENPSVPLNIPTVVAQLAAEDEYCGSGEEEDVSSFTTSVPQPILPPSNSVDTNTPKLPSMSLTPSMDLPSISDLQAPFDAASFLSMEGILSQIPLPVEADAASANPTGVTSSIPVLPRLPQGIVSSSSITESAGVTSNQQPGLSVSTPAVTSTVSHPYVWGISSNTNNNDGRSAEFQTDDSVWVQKSSPGVFLGVSQTHTMPARPCPSGSHKLHADMLMNSGASREESRSPSTAPGTPRAFHPPHSNGQGGVRASGSWRNGMLTHGFSPNGEGTFQNRTRNLTSGGSSLETSQLVFSGNVNGRGFGSTEQRPGASLVPTLPPESAVTIQHALKAGQLEPTSDEEHLRVMNELSREAKEAIDAWDRQGANSASGARYYLPPTN